MEIKSKLIKKKHHKKKIISSESSFVTVIKPELKNGESNWMNLQKLIGPVKRKRSEINTARKKIKNMGLDSTSKDSKLQIFSHKSKARQKKSAENLQNRRIQDENCAIPDKDHCVKKHSFSSAGPEHSKESPIKDESSSYQFNFNKSNHNETIGNKTPVINEEKKLTKAVAMDCEMVGTGTKGKESIIARVSIVNSYGECLYDEFVKPKEKVTDFRTVISGVRPSNLKNGKDLYEVQRDVVSIIEGRILVGHAIKHDLDVLYISHPRHMIRDTALHKPFKDINGGKTPSLKKLTSKILGCEIQSGEHSSVEDAQATMLLYLRQRREFESLARSRRNRKPKMIENQNTS